VWQALPEVARKHAAEIATVATAPATPVIEELLAALNQAGLALDTLSMGMSADLEAAVAEGATIVRIGTAIFGARG